MAIRHQVSFNIRTKYSFCDSEAHKTCPAQITAVSIHISEFYKHGFAMMCMTFKFNRLSLDCGYFCSNIQEYLNKN